MKPVAFDYVMARTLPEALEAKARHGEDARVLAGGQSLVPAMNFRMAQPKVLVDINCLEECAQIQCDASEIRLGALVRYRSLEREINLLARIPILAEALPLISHPQIRSRTTLGGNLAHADPASEMPAIMLALQARFTVASVRGERVIDAQDFFLGPLTTALAPDEVVTAATIPGPLPGAGMCFQEVSRRRGDFAIAGIAVALTMAGGRCQTARIGLCGLADRPLLAPAASRLEGAELSPEEIAAIAAEVADALDPPGGLHASAAYQKHLARVLTERALTIARERGLQGGSRP